MPPKNGAIAEPAPEGDRHDERRDDRGRDARQAEGEASAARGLLISFAPYLVALAFGGAGGGGIVASVRAKDDGKLDQVLVSQAAIAASQKESAEAQKRIETRLTTLEAQGTSAQLEKIEARLRLTEEELAALRALQGRGK